MTDQKTNGSRLPPDGELARLVVETGLASQVDVDQCVEQAVACDQTLSSMLTREGLVTSKQLQRLQVRLEESRKGTSIPGYRLEQRLDAGSQATVFKGRQLSLDRVVAIKV